MQDNRAAFARWRLLPRVLQDVTHVDTSATLFGRRLASPVLVAPMAMQRLCHPGEVLCWVLLHMCIALSVPKQLAQ